MDSASGNILYFKDLEKDGDFVQLNKGFDNDYRFLENIIFFNII